MRVKSHNQKNIENPITTSRQCSCAEHACIILYFFWIAPSQVLQAHIHKQKHEMCFDASDKQTNDVLTLPGTCWKNIDSWGCMKNYQTAFHQPVDSPQQLQSCFSHRTCSCVLTSDKTAVKPCCARTNLAGKGVQPPKNGLTSSALWSATNGQVSTF